MKLCQRKLRSIEDPEQILRRAVLINNTMKQLQAREVCPGEEREGWGRQCEERTVEVKVEQLEVVSVFLEVVVGAPCVGVYGQ